MDKELIRFSMGRAVFTAALVVAMTMSGQPVGRAQTAAPPLPAPGPDSKVQPEVPAGEVMKGEFDQSKVYPGTWREYWVYVPRQLDRTKPAPVMVFQDGLQYNAPVVFDNLIHKKAIPPLVGVFVMHGRVKAPSADALDRMNRSFEYDSVSDDYARFLLEELLPFVSKTHGLTLSNDPNDRAIAGNSSGAIAAFAAAWQRPDAFRRVFSAIGTYVGLRGGNEFPRPHPQDRAKTDPRVPPGRTKRSEQLHRQLVARQPGDAVGAGIRRLRRQPRVGRRRAQLRSCRARSFRTRCAGCGATGRRRSRRTPMANPARMSFRS